MESININGTEYVPADSLTADWEHVCVICTNGWIFEGHADPEDPQHITDAYVVRKWTNGRGLGALAEAAFKDEYTLDPMGDLRINKAAEIGRFSLRW